MRLFRATPETTEFQRRGVAKTDQKPMPNKYPTRPEYTHKKRHFRCQNCYFWSRKSFKKHHGSQERAQARSGTLKIASRALLEGLRGPKRPKTKLWERFSSRTGIRPVRPSKGPNLAHWGPWGRTIIKEFEYNKLHTGSDTPRARGPANFLV